MARGDAVTDRFSLGIDPAELLPGRRDAPGPERPRVDESTQQRAQGPVAQVDPLGGAVGLAPGLPAGKADGFVDAGMDQQLEHPAHHERRHPADHEPLEAAGPLPQLGQDEAGEGQVTGLLLTVVPVHLPHERVGVGVFAGQLLHEVGDLLTGEHQDTEESRHPHQEGQDQTLDAIQEGLVERVLRLGRQLGQQADEEPGVPGLLAQLVEDVGDPGVGEVGLSHDLHGEAGGQDGLEADSLRGDGGDFLPGETDQLLRGQVEVKPGDAEQFGG